MYGMDNSTEREGRVVATVPADTFDHRLMLARSHAGKLTIQDAALKCGLSPQSWSNWEKGMRPHDKVEVAQVVADGLNIDRDWLLHGGPLTKPEPPVRSRRTVRLTYPRRSIRPGDQARRRPQRVDRHERVAP